MSASARFQCTEIAVFVILSCYWELKLLWWSKLAITSTCRKYRASEKVSTVLCRLSNNHPLNFRRLSFLNIFLVCCCV